VRLSRLRTGERLALIGAVALAVLLGLDWYFLSTPDARVGAHETGIRAVGWFAAFLICAATLSGLILVFVTVTQRANALPIVFSVVTFALAFLAVVTIVVRLLWQPHLGVDAGRADVEIELPAWLALFSALTLAAGGWISMADERLDAEESIEHTQEVLRLRNNPRPAPPETAAPAETRPAS
jgi:hypothetical protein